jgi:phage terminase small subunit
MTKLEKKAAEIEESHNRKLTNRQKEFARHYVEGTHSNAQCARLAGYSDVNGIAKIQAHKLLDERDFPHIAEYIRELREDREKKYGVTLLGQLKRFKELSESAEENGQYSASINAERIRSALGGLTIDRRETNHYHAIENMSRDEIENRLKEIREQHPQVFTEAKYEVVNDTETRKSIVDKSQSQDATEVVQDKD